MPFLLRNLTLQPGEDESRLVGQTARFFGLDPAVLQQFRILRKGVDARKKPRVLLVYTVSFNVADEAAFWKRHQNTPDLEQLPVEPPHTFIKRSSADPVVIVGMGHLGQALARSSTFGRGGLRLRGLFDVDPATVGQLVAGHVVEHDDAMPAAALRRNGSARCPSRGYSGGRRHSRCCCRNRCRRRAAGGAACAARGWRSGRRSWGRCGRWTGTWSVSLRGGCVVWCVGILQHQDWSAMGRKSCFGLLAEPVDLDGLCGRMVAGARHD